MPLSVIGAGLGRTGTMSLKIALEQLGFGPCHHMTELFKNPAAPGYWTAAADGETMDWEKVFAGYASTVDWPSAPFYKALADAYPQAKVISTVRDPQAWFKSIQATIMAIDLPPPPLNPFFTMIDKVVNAMFDRRIHDRDHMISVFNAFNAKVRETIPPERLLIYEVSQGWEPLCAFLGVPVPDTLMPRVNSTEEFQAHLARAPTAPV